MLDFITGPMFIISIAVFVVGLFARAVIYVRGLDARADGGDGFLIKAGSLGAGECLAADFQKNTFILNCHKKHHL